MYGKNKVAAPYNQDGKEFLLAEHPFFTIQGEGPDAGRRAIFFRLSRCNLRCWFCDTDFEKEIVYGHRTAMEVITNMAKKERCDLVVITGGEPLLQNIVPLVRDLNKLDIKVSVETAGTVYYDELADVFDPMRSNGNLLVCSPKTPKVHPGIERICGLWKYVLRAIGGMNASTQNRDAISDRPLFMPVDVGVPIYVNPVDEGDYWPNKQNMEFCANLVLANPGWRLGVQIHKLAGLR
jgi:7-carboxy-7-deazaguanine synthase